MMPKSALTAAGRLCPRPALFLFALTLLAAAQILGARAAPTEDSLPFDQGLLWKIETPGAAPSFLFGTMHATDPAVLELPPPVADALGAAESVTLEMVATDEVSRRMAEAMVLKDGRTLEGIIGDERFEAALEAAAKYGLPEQLLQVYAPWAAMTVLSIVPEEFKRLSAGALPLDQALQAHAQRRGLAIHGLESVEEQIAIFSNVPEAEQIELLEMTLREHARIADWYYQIKDAYLAGNTGMIYQLMRLQATGADPGLIAAFEERLIDRRNRRMAARLTDRLDEGRTFVAIGALHLPGEDGVLALLERQGRKVTRVY